MSGASWVLIVALAGPGGLSGTATPTPAVVDRPVTFTASVTSSTGALTFQWNFGDGTPDTPFSAGSTAQHVYAAAGHYTITVRAQDDAGLAPDVQFNLTVHNVLPARPPTHSSTILLDAARGKVWTVNADSDTVARIDTTSNARDAEVAVGRNPRSIAQAADGTIWVVSQQHPSISVIDPVTAALLHVIPLPHGSLPYGIAMSPDGASAFVTLQGLGGVRKFRTATRWETASAAAPPSARGIAVTDGGRVFVTRFISPATTGEVVELRASDLKAIRTISLAFDPGDTLSVDPDTAIAGRGVPNYLTSLAVTPDLRRLWIPSKKDNTARGQARDGRSLTFEKTVRTIVSSIDLSANTEVAGDRFDFDNSDLAQFVTCTEVGDLMFVSLQGTNKIVVFDLYTSPPGLKGAIVTQAPMNPSPQDDPVLPPLTGLSPQGMVIDPATRKLFVTCYMSRTVLVYDVSGMLDFSSFATPPLLATASTVAAELLPANVLRGKQIFYNSADLRMSLDGYLACATCHLDGGSDQRVWDFTQRGEGFRNTTMLQGRGGTAHGFVHWSANFDEIQDFENDIRNGFGGLGFMKDADFSNTSNTYAGDGVTPPGIRKAGLSVELDKLSAYVSSLTKVNRSPFRNADGSLTAQGEAGEAVFKSQQCATCHSGSRFTDSQVPATMPNAATPTSLHDVGTIVSTSGQRLGGPLTGIDTPTLKGLWETGPYLHDGSAATLLDVIQRVPNNLTHGDMHLLTPIQQQDLARYLLEIDEVDAPEAVGGPAPTVTLGAVSSGRPYSLATAGNGGLVYVDRCYTLVTDISGNANLNGKVLLRTAEDDVVSTSSSLVSFTLTTAADVYVYLDTGITQNPAWIGTLGFVSSPPDNLRITPGAPGNERLLVAFKKTFAAGTVTLGGIQNGGPTGAGRNYFVIINPVSQAFEEGPISQGEWVHDRDQDGDGLLDDFEAVTASTVVGLSPWTFNSVDPSVSDEDQVSGGKTLFELQLAAMGGGGGGGGGCGLISPELLLPLAVLARLLRRRSTCSARRRGSSRR